MAKEEELKRIDLKVNVSCCEGCRRKVMKAMSLKGVLRTEIKPSHDRVTVVGDVDAKVLVRKLARVGKIAEVLAPSASQEDPGNKRGDDGWKKQDDDGDKPTEEKKSKGKDDDGKSASRKQECKKCARGAAAAAEDAATEKVSTPKGFGADDEGDGGFGTNKSSPAPEHAAAAAVQQFHQHYHRAEPAMVVPVQVPPPYYAAVPYYAVPPVMGMPPRRPPQPSRFDADFFDDDNTAGCRVM